MSDELNSYSPYCQVCSGCGEEGCCSPLMCKMSPNGDYCESYLRDLKFTYMMYSDIMGMIGEDEKYKNDIDKVWDKNFQRFYK